MTRNESVISLQWLQAFTPCDFKPTAPEANSSAGGCAVMSALLISDT